MGKNLVIVESPAKANTINKIIGNDYIVKSSVGHIRDLPVKTLGVDLEDSFKPKYVIVKGKKKIITELKKAAEKADCVYLAPDPDREGEAIAWHLQEILKSGGYTNEIKRVQFNEITPKAIKSAFEHPGVVDIDRVNAQQARRILDRIVGYKVSPMLWRRIRRGLSAGRVQSVALRLVCERETEIDNFVSEEYWIFGALAKKLVEPTDPFNLKLVRIGDDKAEIKSAEQLASIKSDLEGSKLKVADVVLKTIHKKPSPPYITSTLQQAGSSYCSYSPQRTMSLAQRLYEGIDIGGEHVGLITYMRTDSFAISQDALDSTRDYIKTNYGDKYCPEKPNYYKSRKSAQEAHEAIRPTDVTRTPESLKSKLPPAELKLYRLIWRRFVSSQMVPAEIEQRTVKVDAIPASTAAVKYLLQATASDVKFPGYMKAAGSEAEQKKDDEEVPLPQLAVAEDLECAEWLEERKETKPPARYSEAALVRVLEGNGVGRPSTFAQILSTLQNRKYVDRQNRSLFPTDLGKEVSDMLVKNLGELFDVSFTASMEEALDAVEDGSLEWTKMLADFYAKFEVWMEKAKLPPADINTVKTVLNALSGVTEWLPEAKKGKRVYSDSKFVDSISKQVEDGEKPVSQRQLSTLVKISCHYREQVPEMDQIMTDAGFAEMMNSPELQPPRDETMKKLELLKTVEIDERGRDFVNSLTSQAESGRCLSAAQIHALNNVVMSHAEQIPDFEKIKPELAIADTDVVNDDESADLLKAMEGVKEWNPPVKRGKREFNDENFYNSLCDHFGRKGFLSERQRAALKRMMGRYSDQIVGFAELAKKFEIKLKKSPAKKK